MLTLTIRPRPAGGLLHACTRMAPLPGRRPGWTQLALFFCCFSLLQGQSQEATLRELLEQNRLLRDQARAQQTQINELKQRIEQLAVSQSEHDEKWASIQAASKEVPIPADTPDRRVIISGQGAFSYTDAQSRGELSKAGFRVDDARVYIESQIRRNTYLFGELILTQRQTKDDAFHLGEFYLDLENLFGDSVADRLVNLRVGRLGIPFGLEYLHRYPIHNPLITHSVSDFWGIDEGVEAYGESGRVSYVLAVQNGGVSQLRDFNRDKSVTVRISWKPLRELQLSLSGFRTGRLDRAQDNTSEMWIGNAFFRAIGKATSTNTYQAELGQFDASWTWASGSLSGAAGRGSYDDDDSTADNGRSFKFYQTQLVQDIWSKLYSAIRYSSLSSNRGYYLQGLGNYKDYFRGETLTRRISRFALGLGYRFSPDLIFKVEHTWEDARKENGDKRPDENQVAAEVAVRF